MRFLFPNQDFWRHVRAQAPRRQPRASGFQRTPAQGRPRLGGGQHHEQSQRGRWRAYRTLPHQRPHCQQHGHQRQGARESVSQPGAHFQPVQRIVGTGQALVGQRQRVALGREACGHRQFSLTRHQIHGPRAQQLGRQRTPHRCRTRAPRQPHRNRAARQHQPKNQCQAQRPMQRTQHHARQQGCTQRCRQRHQQAQIHRFQRVNIGSQPKQQTRRAQQQLARRFRARPAAKQLLAQIGQHGQRGVVRHQPFTVARQSAPHRQQANARRGHEHIEHDGSGRMQTRQRGGRDEPAREAQQSHSQQHRQHRQRGTQQQQARPGR